MNKELYPLVIKIKKQIGAVSLPDILELTKEQFLFVSKNFSSKTLEEQLSITEEKVLDIISKQSWKIFKDKDITAKRISISTNIDNTYIIVYILGIETDFGAESSTFKQLLLTLKENNNENLNIDELISMSSNKLGEKIVLLEKQIFNIPNRFFFVYEHFNKKKAIIITTQKNFDYATANLKYLAIKSLILEKENLEDLKKENIQAQSNNINLKQIIDNYIVDNIKIISL